MIRRSSASVAIIIAVVSAWFPMAVAHAGAVQREACFVVADDIDPSGGGEGFADVLLELDVEDLHPGVTELMVGTPGTEHIEAIAFDATGVLYAADEEELDEGQLGIIDVTDAAWAGKASAIGTGDGAVGPQELADVDSLDFDPRDGSLWGTVRRKGAPDLLITIDTATGAHVADAFGAGVDYLVIEPVQDELVDVDDIAIDDDGTIFAIANKQGGGDRLVTIDPADGSTTDVGPLGTTDVEGLDFSVHGHLWGSTGNKNPDPSLWRIDPATGASTRHMGLGEAVDYEALSCMTLDAAAVTVVPGACRSIDDGSLTAVDITITPSGGATVVLERDGDEVGTFTASDTVQLGPGSYTWSATPAPGFFIDGPSSGKFSAASCVEDQVFVAVTLTTCQNIGGVERSEFGVSITPADAATVEVRDDDGDVVGTVTGSGGTLELPPGDYTYVVVPEPGFTVVGPTSGSVTAEPCPPATVSVRAAPCVLNPDGTFTSRAVIDISTPGAALVTIRRGGTEIATLTKSGTVDLPVSDGVTVFRWEAEPTILGTELIGQTSGTLPVSCVLGTQTSVDVQCVFDEATEEARARVSIGQPDAATVTVAGPGSYEQTFTESALSDVLTEPGTYGWVAVPAPGWELSPGPVAADGSKSGTFSLDPEARVCVLSATGMDVRGIGSGGFAFLIIGALLSLAARIRPSALRQGSVLAVPLAAALLASGRRTRRPARDAIIGALSGRRVLRA